MIKPQTLKGFRDFLPAEARKRQYVINTLKKVFERFGFEPLETPVLEYGEILAGKYGDEGDQLMYRFKDRGDRDVAMRYDQTVPLARVVAQYQNELPTPFKRYQIQPVWRAENTQKGRYREFLQCDIDTVGVDSPSADAEILALVYDAYKALGLNITIKYNDRALLKEISPEALPVIDKLNKIGEEGVIKELMEKGFDEQKAQTLLNQAKAFEETLRLLEIKEQYKQMGYPQDSLQFDGTLIRGLNYYTGLIVEVVIRDNVGSLSLGGGGRYDNLIGMFGNGNIPAVGFAFGFDRTIEAMEELKLFPADLSLATAQVLVTVFSEEFKQKSLELCSRLRSNNINAEIYLGEIKDKNPLEKQLKYAIQKNIPYLLILGPEEEQNNRVTVKNLRTREQKQTTIEELIERVKR
jgi:histidyl-tRNA synthetase